MNHDLAHHLMHSGLGTDMALMLLIPASILLVLALMVLAGIVLCVWTTIHTAIESIHDLTTNNE